MRVAGGILMLVALVAVAAWGLPKLAGQASGNAVDAAADAAAQKGKELVDEAGKKLDEAAKKVDTAAGVPEGTTGSAATEAARKTAYGSIPLVGPLLLGLDAVGDAVGFDDQEEV